MRTVRVHRELIAGPATAWDLLVDPRRWPEWGPSVRSAEVDGGVLGPGAEGTVTTAVGVRLPFRVTSFEPGRRWAWAVAGLPATDHTVEATSPGRCRVGFGVPWPAAPYLAVCRVALDRLDNLARRVATDHHD